MSPSYRKAKKNNETGENKKTVRHQTRFTWTVVGVWRQLIAVTTRAVVAIIRVDAQL